MGCLVAAIGAACMALSAGWRNEVLAPGPLSLHHAHLIAGQDQSLRCAQCHTAANASLEAWMGQAGDVSSQGLSTTQSTLCMSCHDRSFAREWATAAHNMPLATLREFTAAHAVDGPDSAASSHALRDPGSAIACSACHREHQGRMHDLTAISDAACQACHREQYRSFADDHPDFGAWPYERRTRIAFDHASHQLKHHPATKREFACADCHQADATGAFQLTNSYAATCASCHDKALALSLADGVPLVALPTLDLEALRNAGHNPGAWPEGADGDFDGAVPWAAKLLIAASPEAASALARLGSNFDFYDIDPDDDDQLNAAATIARELRTLVEELAAGNQQAFSGRLAAMLGRQPAPEEVAALMGRLTPETVADYRNHWFGDGGTDESAASSTTAPGVWSRHDAKLALRYRPTGHADLWLKAWLDALAAAASGPRAAVADPLLRAALKPTAPGQCGSCHTVERDATGQLAIQWQPRRPGQTFPGLTHFSHASHLLQSQLHDCTTCHRVVEHAAGSLATEDPRQFVADFAPLTKAACVNCHTPTAAGNSCTQCHRYHSGPWGTDVAKTVIPRSVEESARK